MNKTYKLLEENKMKDTNITFKLSEAEKERIKALAAKEDIPMSQLIRQAVKDYIQRNEG